MMNTQAPAEQREAIARLIHNHMRPENIAKADWDGGAILGEDNVWRHKVYATADALIAEPLLWGRA